MGKKENGPTLDAPAALEIKITMDRRTGGVGVVGPLDNMPAVDYMLNEARRQIESRYMKRVALAESGIVLPIGTPIG